MPSIGRAALGVTTSAEGVETPEQLECLRREGCTEVQGFLYGRPRPSIQLEEVLADPHWPGSLLTLGFSQRFPALHRGAG
jgi:predicted signal transduction protein with EAL and GGDEF domain